MLSSRRHTGRIVSIETSATGSACNMQHKSNKSTDHKISIHRICNIIKSLYFRRYDRRTDVSVSFYEAVF